MSPSIVPTPIGEPNRHLQSLHPRARHPQGPASGHAQRFRRTWPLALSVHLAPLACVIPSRYDHTSPASPPCPSPPLFHFTLVALPGVLVSCPGLRPRALFPGLWHQESGVAWSSLFPLGARACGREASGQTYALTSQSRPRAVAALRASRPEAVWRRPALPAPCPLARRPTVPAFSRRPLEDLGAASWVTSS